MSDSLAEESREGSAGGNRVEQREAGFLVERCVLAPCAVTTAIGMIATVYQHLNASDRYKAAMRVPPTTEGAQVAWSVLQKIRRNAVSCPGDGGFCRKI